MITKLSERYAPLAQLDRASGYGPEGRGFESLTAYHPGTVVLQRFRGFLMPVCGARVTAPFKIVSGSLCVYRSYDGLWGGGFLVRTATQKARTATQKARTKAKKDTMPARTRNVRAGLA